MRQVNEKHNVVVTKVLDFKPNMSSKYVAEVYVGNAIFYFSLITCTKTMQIRQGLFGSVSDDLTRY